MSESVGVYIYMRIKFFFSKYELTSRLKPIVIMTILRSIFTSKFSEEVSNISALLQQNLR